MLLMITLLTFGAITLLILGLTLKSERNIIQDRMIKHGAYQDTDIDLVRVEMERSFNERIMKPSLRKLANIAERVTPTGTLQAIEAKLETAGRPWHMAGWEFLGLNVISVIVFSLIGIFLAGYLSGYTLLLRGSILTFFGVLAIGFPDFMLTQTINNRQIQIRKVLPDTLDLLLVSVEAGLGLDAAIQRVTDKMRNPLASELSRTLLEMRVGKSRIDTLRDMANRVKVQELSTFVATICQADQLGVSISHVLRVQSIAIRNARAQRARETASKLPVKMLFPLVFFIFPAIFVVILAPGAIMIAKALGISK